MRPIRGKLRRAEAWARWLELAAELELEDLVDEGDLRLPGGPPALHPPDRVEAALDRLAGLARRRIPRYAIAPDGLSIRIDVRATRSNLRAVTAELERVAGEERRRLAVAELDREARAGGLSAGRVATRWGIDKATLYRWRAELGGVAISRRDATPGPEIVDDDQVARPPATPRPAAGTTKESRAA